MVQFSEDFLSWTLLQTTTGLWSYDIENNLMSWNEAVFQIHGLDQDFEPSLNAMTELFIAEYQEFLKTSIDNAIELGKPWDLELKIQTPSGVTKWLHSIGRAIREDDKTIRLESVIVNIDEKKSTELELQKTLRSLGGLDCAINDYLVVTRTNEMGIITYGNDNFCQLSQYSTDEIKNQPHSLVNSGHHKDEFWKQFWKQLNSKRPWQGEIKNKAKDGSFYWTDSQVIPILDEYGKIIEFIHIQKNISDKKENESIINESEKLALVGETTAQIFHDVMNPLTVVLLSTQMMRKKLPDDFDQKPVQRIISSVEKVKDMFQGVKEILLDGEQGIEKSMQSANLKQIVTKALERVCLKLEQFNVDVNPFQMDDNVFVSGPELDYTQVLINLINNSIDAIKEFDNKWINIESAVLGGHAYITITDCGQGIPERNHERIFSNLFSTKKKEGGIGLGLGICRKILRRCGGDVNINKNSTNTSFIVSFKIVDKVNKINKESLSEDANIYKN